MLSIAVAVAGLCCQSAYSQGFTAIVAFGDSLSDIGNTAATLSNTFTGYNSYYYDQGRWSNGPVWVENLARQIALPALQRNDGTNLYGTDFAWGGSTSGSGYTYEYLANLQEQVSLYIDLLTTKYAQMPDIGTTLFTVWSGGNDVIYYVEDDTSLTPQQICNHIADAITDLYHAGGRHFLVPNLPPLGDKPNYLHNKTYHDKANAFVSAYNPLLQTRLALLRQQLSGIQIVPFDIYRLFKAVLMDPKPYHLTNVTDPAFTPNDDPFENYGSVVANPDEYLFWDTTHPTRRGHAIIATALEGAVEAAFAVPLGETRRSPVLLAGSGW
jgi:phospholipase/lecithinase/hemolysin